MLIFVGVGRDVTEIQRFDLDSLKMEIVPNVFSGVLPQSLNALTGLHTL